MLKWLQDLENQRMIQILQESSWIYPSLEVLHILSFSILFGSATLWDLRLLGFFKKINLSEFEKMALPVARTAFGFAIIAGFFLFLANPVETFENLAFRIKLVLLFFAVLNTVIFHLRFRQVAIQHPDGRSKAQAKIQALFSLFLWAGVITAGRWIAYI